MKQTQQKRVLEALIDAGDRGINSFEARVDLHLIQLPTRIKELKEQGHVITSETMKNKSVQYRLAEFGNKIYEREGKDWVWDINEEGNAYKKYL